MKKLFNKKAFALLLCLVLALTALLTVTAFADTAPADGTAAQTEEAADSGVSAKAIASGVAIFLVVYYNKKKAVPAIANNAAETTDEE